MGHPDRIGPESYPEAFCCGWTPQHTGTWFLGATLRALTGTCGTGWPPTAIGSAGQPTGWRLQHIYGEAFVSASSSGPGHDCGVFEQRWIRATDFPVIVTLRHPQRSLSTLIHRTGPKGVRGYYVDEHIETFRRVARVLEDPRFHAFQVDCGAGYKGRALTLLRIVELELMMAHIGRDPVGGHDALASWAASWQPFNARNLPLIKDPAVPADVLEALGYEPLPSNF